MNLLSNTKHSASELTRPAAIPALIAGALALAAAGGFEYGVLSVGEDARYYRNATGIAIFSAARAILLMLALIAFLPRIGAARLRALWSAFAILIYCALTILWAQMEMTTVSGVFRLACAMVPGLWIVCAPSRMEAMVRLGHAALFIVLITGISVLLFPELAFMRGQHEGALRGPFMHKNGLGFHLAVASLVFVCRFLDTRHPLWLAALAGAIVSMIFAWAMAAMVIGALGILFCAGLWFCAISMGRHVATYAFGLTLLAVPALLFLPEFIGPLLTPLGYDPGLNGRDLIWSYAYRMAQAGSILGHGYEAFWPTVFGTGPQGFAQSWQPLQAHNGFLDAWLAGGAIGAALTVLVFIVLWWRGILALGSSASLGIRIFPLSAAVVLIAYNSIETLFPAGGSFAPGLVVALLGFRAMPVRVGQ